MGSVNYFTSVSACAEGCKIKVFYPSDCRLNITKYYRLYAIMFLLVVLCHSLICFISVYSDVVKSIRSNVKGPYRKVSSGTKANNNCRFTTSIFACLQYMVITLILSQSGDVHPNPGPDSASCLSSSVNENSSLDNSLRENLSIVHINIQSLFPKLDILSIELQPYDIVVITETWLSRNNSDNDILIPNFDPLYKKDRNRNDRVGGGVAIYIKCGISLHRRLNIIDNIVEGLCIEIKIRNHKSLLCGIYRPPNSGNEYWDAIEHTLENLNNSITKDLIILGDFNCNMLNNNINNKMRNLMTSYNLTQIIEEPTHYTENSASLIDVALLSNPENVVFSDVISPFIPNLIRFHCPIMVTLKFRKPANKSFKRHIWLYDRGDYTLYRDKLSQINWDEVFSLTNINDITLAINQRIIEAANDSIPNKTITVRPQEAEWINSHIKRLIRQRKRLFRIAKRNNTEAAWAAFKRKRNDATNEIRKAKQTYFRKLTHDLQNNARNSKKWHKLSNKFLKQDSQQKTISFLEYDDDIIESEYDKAELLNKFFTEQSTVDDSSSILPEFMSPSYDPLNTIEISASDVIQAIKRFDVNKASGPDLISPKLIKEGMSQLVNPFTRLFNLFLRLKTVPDPWKESNVIPVHKKDNTSDPNNYRPISLLSNVGKLMERCVHKHLNEYLMINNIITPNQSGFQSGGSTVNQLLYLNNTFLKALDDGKEVRVLFCDISKAFDRVWHKGLLFKLKSIGISNELLQWFSDYLSNRRQRVCLKGQFSSWRQVTAGVPQGSILGPTSFLIYINLSKLKIQLQLPIFSITI